MNGTHDLVAGLAPGYVIGALDPQEQQAFEAHLAICDVCALEVRSLSTVVSGLAASVPQQVPPAQLRARVLAAIAEGPERDSAAASTAVPMPASAAGPRRAFAWLPVAAALLIAAGLSLYVVTLRQRIGELEARLDEVSARLLLADRAVSDAQQQAVRLQSVTAVLLAPDLARIDLMGEGAAPDAAARALWSRASGMVFTATNLPQLPAGRTYQVWVVTAERPLSAGLVEPDADGQAIGVFETSPDIPAPVAVAVTVEPAGGVPAPTGPRYLLGTAG